MSSRIVVALVLAACTDPPPPSAEGEPPTRPSTPAPEPPDPPETSGDCEETVRFADLDGDGFGSDPLDPCGPEAGVPRGGDCDDGDPAIHPDATERCNGLDDDCDPGSDEVVQIGETGYRSIADALAAAPDGALIEICDGTHEEHGLRIDLPVTVASWSGVRDAVVIDGTGTDSVFVVDGGELVLQSLTVRAGVATEYAPNLRAGGGVNAMVGAGGRVTVEDCVFEDHSGTPSASYGAAVAGSDLVLIDSTFTRNVAGWGGAVFVDADGSLVVEGCTFEENRSDQDGGAVYRWGAGPRMTITGSTFTRNVTEGDGGAIAASDLDVVDSDFVENEADYGGAIANPYPGTRMTISGGTFDANVAVVGPSLAWGGAVVSYTALTVTDATFVGNQAGIGGAVYVDEGPLELVGVTVTDNFALYDAGGVYMSDGDATADAATLIASNRTDGIGGGVFVDAGNDAASWSGGTITDNFAVDVGGGIYAQSNAFAPGAAVTVADVLVEGNESDWSGGGVYLTGPAVTLRDAVLSDNGSPVGGGSSLNDSLEGESLVERVTWIGNHGSDGGASDLWQARARLVDCVLDGNAANRGGALFLDRDSVLQLETTDFGVGTPNSPDDVYQDLDVNDRSYAELGADATLTCTPSGGCQ